MRTEGEVQPPGLIRGRNQPDTTTYITIPTLGYGAQTYLRPESDCWITGWRINSDGGLDLLAVDENGNAVELRRVE